MKNRKIYPWIVVGLLWFVALLNYMDRQMLSTMKDAMQIDIIELQSATNFGRLMAVFLWIYGLMSPMAGIIADRVSRKWLIVGSLFVWSAVTYGMGYADTLCELMSHDKKNDREGLNFTLLESVGQFSVDNYCSRELVMEALRQI